MAKILSETMGLAPGLALSAAKASGGSVKRALNTLDTEPSKMAVINVINALATRDFALFEASVARWSQEDHEMLLEWLSEALAGHWRVFTEEQSRGLQRDRVLLTRLATLLNSSARPRLAMKVAAPVLIGE